jgi:hypothetical protein
MLLQPMLRGILAAMAVVVLSGGCFSRDPFDIHSRHAAQKIPAIREAVDAGDKSIIPQLVHDLDSSDPAIRFYAIEGLQRLTGETFGYLYYEDAAQRRPAVMNWRKWLEESKGSLADKSSASQ